MTAEAAVALKAVKSITQKQLEELLEVELEYRSKQKQLKELEERRDGLREYVKVLHNRGVAVQRGDLYVNVKRGERQNAVKWMEVCSRELGPEFVEGEKEKVGRTVTEVVEVLKRS